MKEFKGFCGCGLELGHEQKCMSFNVDKKKDKIGKYSGLSKNYDGFQKVRRGV